MIVLHTHWKLSWIILLAFSTRFALRYYLGSADFWVNGYGFYFVLAQNIVAGNGISSAVGRGLYPAFLAAVTFGQKLFFPLVLFQSLIGAGLIHDTALQETSLFTFLTAVAVLLLLRVRRNGPRGTAGCAGLMLGVAGMARPTFGWNFTVRGRNGRHSTCNWFWVLVDKAYQTIAAKSRRYP
jgi:hypothetical protein